MVPKGYITISQWDFWWVCVNTKCPGSWQQEVFKTQSSMAGKLISFPYTLVMKLLLQAGIYEFQCLSLWTLHCKKPPVLKELPGRGHCCVPPTSHLFSSAGSGQIISYSCVVTADLQNGAYSILLHVLPNARSCCALLPEEFLEEGYCYNSWLRCQLTLEKISLA